MAGRVVANLLILCGVASRPTPLFRPHRDVVTTQGAVRGYLAGGSTPHFAYFGLPYGRPPTGHDRYKAPKPPPSWDGIFEATHKIKCPQPDGDGEENCLVVNVFTPTDAESLSVIVLVHGGGFQNGWGAHQPPQHLLREGFVLVSFNYRLAALGFLCLGTAEASGNAGLKDQIAALYWINRNIANFGGNPSDVIVYGIDSGAASVQLLLMSGLAKGLLHKVILESGSAISPISMSYEPITTAVDAASNIGYNNNDNLEDLLQFYLSAPAKELINIPNMFLPCVENESYYVHTLLDVEPLHILKQGSYDKVPLMLVFSDNEGKAVIGNEIQTFQKVPENFADLLPNNLEFDNDELTLKVADIVKEFYFGDDFNRGNISENYAEYINDVFSEYPTVKFGILYAAKSSHPVYIMKTHLENIHTTSDDAATQKFCTILDYIYNTDIENIENQVFEQLMILWRNFIKISDPTPLTTTLIPVIWQMVGTNGVENADVSTVPILQFPDLKMTPPPLHQRLLFLDNIYNRFYKPHVLETSYSQDLDDND